MGAVRTEGPRRARLLALRSLPASPTPALPGHVEALRAVLARALTQAPSSEAAHGAGLGAEETWTGNMTKNTPMTTKEHAIQV